MEVVLDNIKKHNIVQNEVLNDHHVLVETNTICVSNTYANYSSSSC